MLKTFLILGIIFFSSFCFADSVIATGEPYVKVITDGKPDFFFMLDGETLDLKAGQSFCVLADDDRNFVQLVFADDAIKVKLNSDEKCHVVQVETGSFWNFLQAFNSIFVVESIPIQGSGTLRGPKYQLFLPENTILEHFSFFKVLPKADSYSIMINKNIEAISPNEVIALDNANIVAFSLDTSVLETGSISILIDNETICSVYINRDLSIEQNPASLIDEANAATDILNEQVQAEMLAYIYSVFAELNVKTTIDEIEDIDDLLFAVQNIMAKYYWCD